MDYLSENELARVVNYCLKNRSDATDLVLLVLGTGLRVGEISGAMRGGTQRGGIRLSDIRVDATNSVFIRVWGEKTDQWRTVAVMPEIAPMVAARVGFLRHRGECWCFPSNVRKRPAGKRTLQRWWGKTMSESGVRQIPIHKGRSTYATWEARRLSLPALQDQLGHAAGSKTTLQYYTTTIPELRYQGTDYVPKWLAVLRGNSQRRLSVVHGTGT